MSGMVGILMAEVGSRMKNGRACHPVTAETTKPETRKPETNRRGKTFYSPWNIAIVDKKEYNNVV